MLLNKTKKRTRNGDCKVVVSKAVWSMRVKWGRKKKKEGKKIRQIKGKNILLFIGRIKVYPERM